MPQPVSRTARRTRAAEVASAWTSMRPWSTLYLIALDSRLTSTCCSRSRSARTASPSATSTSTAMPRRAASGRTSRRASSTTVATTTRSGTRSMRPLSMRARSRMSAISASRWRPPLTISCTWRCAALPAGRSSSSNWPKPRIALSGVRSSWLIVDRNALLARLARSASSRAHCKASLACRVALTSWTAPASRTTAAPSRCATPSSRTQRCSRWTVRSGASNSKAVPSRSAAAQAWRTRWQTSAPSNWRKASAQSSALPGARPRMRRTWSEQRSALVPTSYSQLPTPARRLICSSRSSCRASANCACFCAVMSVRIARNCPGGRPSSGLSGMIVVATQNVEPSLRRLHSSPCQISPRAIVRHSPA